MNLDFDIVLPCLLNTKTLSEYMSLAQVSNQLNVPDLRVKDWRDFNEEYTHRLDDLRYQLYGSELPATTTECEGKWIGYSNGRIRPVYYDNPNYVWTAHWSLSLTPLGKAVSHLAQRDHVDPSDWVQQYLYGHSQERWTRLVAASSQPCARNTIEDWVRLLSLGG